MECVWSVAEPRADRQSGCVTNDFHTPDRDRNDGAARHLGPVGSLIAQVERHCRTVLAGKHVWGSVEIGLPRQGFKWYRLVVFPPGTTDSERRRFRLAYGWPAWGAVLFVISLIYLGDLFGPWLGLATSATVWLGTGVWVFIRVGDVRPRVRTLSVVLIDRHYDPLSADRFARLESAFGQLERADLLLTQGQISTADHELRWGLAYDLLATDRTRPVDRPRLIEGV
jgi:hypothetical protein